MSDKSTEPVTADEVADFIQRALRHEFGGRPLAEDLHGSIAAELIGPTDGATRIAAERVRQVEVEGWTAEHDAEEHAGGDLVEAAIAYLENSDPREVPDCWPWDASWWKPSEEDPIRNLEKAGALIAAEIDRLLEQRRAAEGGA